MVGKIVVAIVAIVIFFVWACVVAFCCAMLVNSNEVEKEIEEDQKDDKCEE